MPPSSGWWSPRLPSPTLRTIWNLAEDMLKYVIRDVMERCPDELAMLNKFVDKGLLERLDHVASSDFARVTYTEAIDILLAAQAAGRAFEYPVEWGIDLQTEHERFLTEEHFGRPTFVIDYPVGIKAFYMRLNDDGQHRGRHGLPRAGHRRDHRRLPARGAPGSARAAHRRAGHGRRAVPVRIWTCAVSAPASTRASGSGFERLVMYLTGVQQYPRRHPAPAHGGQRRVLRGLRGRFRPHFTVPKRSGASACATMGADLSRAPSVGAPCEKAASMEYITAGESHGPNLTAIVTGVPAGLPVSVDQINSDLARRQAGYGRGGRMAIEKRYGARHERRALRSHHRHVPSRLRWRNRDWENWTERMAAFGEAPRDLVREVTPRPGHADLVGALQHEHRRLPQHPGARERPGDGGPRGRGRRGARVSGRRSAWKCSRTWCRIGDAAHVRGRPDGSPHAELQAARHRAIERRALPGRGGDRGHEGGHRRGARGGGEPGRHVPRRG